MSLATQGLNLIREGFALAIDCACCIAEQCDNIPCVSSRECQEAGLVPDATCKCLQGQCTSLDCLTDEDCPEGYYCLDGVCVPNCTGEPCTEDFDCNDGCVCAGGQCFPASDMVYCQRDPDDLEADPRCRFGRPSDPSLIVGGPFTSYGICCFVGCDCKYICNPVSYACDPNPDGEYGSQSECEGACGDPDDLGRCCQSVVDYDENGKAISYETGPADVCPSTREWCKSDPPVEPPGQRTFRSFNPLFDNCDLCPVNAQGPCCLDGECKMGLDRLECEDAGGEFKGDSWIDCETPRDPSVGQFFDYACPGCNGQGDCACEDNEFCDGMACSECGDNLFDVTPGQTTFTGIELSKPSKLYVYIRDCKFGERIDGDREVSVYVGGQLVGKVTCRDKTNECTNGGVIETNLEGEIELREASTDITVCITVEDAGDKDACCVTRYRTNDGTDPATETDFPTAEAAISWCEEQDYPNPLSDCYAVPGVDGGWIWRQAVADGEPECIPGCEDCSPPIFDENTPLDGFYKECVAGKTCDDNPCLANEEWYVDCYTHDGIAECNDCGAGPFTSDTEANAWMNANPPPEGCEYTLVNPTRRNPLP